MAIVNKHTGVSLKLSAILFLSLWASLMLLQMSSQAYSVEVVVNGPVIEEPEPEPVPPPEVPPAEQPPSEANPPSSTPTPTPTPSPTPPPPEPANPPAPPEPGPRETIGLGATIANILAFLSDFRNNPTVQAISERVLTPAATAVAATVAGLASLALFNSAKDVVPVANHFLNSFLSLFALKKKKTVTWSQIYDSSGKLPIDLAVIRLLDSRTGAVRGTTVSDSQGRFAFELAPGNYTLQVSKPLYLFPSKLLAGLTRDNRYENLYFGATVQKSSPGVLEITVPLDPVAARQTSTTFIDKLRSLFDKVSAPALIIGILIAGIVLYVMPTVLNGVIFGVYLLLVILKRAMRRKVVKPWGKVIDLATGRPVPGIVVRAFDEKYNKLLDTKITDSTGGFNFLLPPGKYYLKILSYQYRFPTKPTTEERAYAGGVFEVLSGTIERKNLYVEQYSAQVTYTLGPQKVQGDLHAETIFDYFEGRNQDAAKVVRKLAR